MTEKPIYIALHSASTPIELPPHEPSAQWGTFTHAVIDPGDLRIHVAPPTAAPTIEQRREHSRRTYGRRRRR